MFTDVMCASQTLVGPESFSLSRRLSDLTDESCLLYVTPGAQNHLFGCHPLASLRSPTCSCEWNFPCFNRVFFSSKLWWTLCLLFLFPCVHFRWSIPSWFAGCSTHLSVQCIVLATHRFHLFIINYIAIGAIIFPLRTFTTSWPGRNLHHCPSPQEL